MQRLVAFLILLTIKVIASIFFPAKGQWLGPIPKNPWKNIRLMMLLNHTSLYEPLFIQVIPVRYLWHLAANFNIPGADITLERPFVGRFWKLMVPKISSVTRKKDISWDNYLKSIKPHDVVMIAPEGRMKRPNGLDKYGKKMTVRGGVADIIETMDDGAMILCFSGGLHHVQRPGQFLPHLFKPIKMNLSYHSIADYKAQFTGTAREVKLGMVQDLQKRLERDCP